MTAGRRCRVVWLPAAEVDAGTDLHLVARQLAREEIAAWLDVGPSEVTIEARCPQCGGAHGRPWVEVAGRSAVPWLSISRSSGTVLVALSDAGPVGVDAELCSAARFEGFESVALHPAETTSTTEQRTATWVRKESLLKAAGVGLDLDPRLVQITPADESPALEAWPADIALQSPVWMFDLALDATLVGSVTVMSPERPALEVRQVAQGAGSRGASAGVADRSAGRRTPQRGRRSPRS